MTRYYFVGDSHVHAIMRALKAEPDRWKNVSATRIERVTASKSIGGLSLDEVVDTVAELPESSVVVTLLGGSLHITMGLVQHPVEFDILDGAQTSVDHRALVPTAVMKAQLMTVLRGNILEKLGMIRAATRGDVFQLLAPPPKSDIGFLQRHLKRFEERVMEHGLSDPKLVLKIWQLHNQCVAELCRESGVVPIPVPEAACDPHGFLRPEYYGEDTGHANARYGALVIEQVRALKAPAPLPG